MNTAESKLLLFSRSSFSSLPIKITAADLHKSSHSHQKLHHHFQTSFKRVHTHTHTQRCCSAFKSIYICFSSCWKMWKVKEDILTKVPGWQTRQVKDFVCFFFLNYKTSNKWVWKLIKIRRTTYARTHTRTVEMQLSNKILNYN